MQKILYYLWVMWLTVSIPIRKTYTATTCGHQTKKTGKISPDSESSIMSMPLSKNGNPDYCLDCLGKMSIKCAWCKNPIHIGDPVTLYIPEESFEIPKHAVKYHEDERCLVGCLGWDCASSGADRQGFWVPPGKVERVPSPMGLLMSDGNSGRAIIVDDLSNPSDLGRLI